MALSGKRLLLLGFVVVLLVVIPLTVYLVQQQQKLRVRAVQSTILSLVPQTQSKAVGDNVSLQVSMNPGQNQVSNQVSFAKLTITYDSTKLGEPNLAPNSSIFPSALQGPTYTPGTPASASITLSVGSDTSKIIQSSNCSPSCNIATITFKALAETGGTSTTVAFDQANGNTQVLSIASSDQFNENVLLTANSATVTIGPGTATPTPTPTPPGATPTPTPTPPGGGTTGKGPVCNNLFVDKATTGTAPYSINFTASGTTSAGTISKVTFVYGDGTTNDVTTGGGIGTSSVNVSLVHIYNNPGTFTAKATLTDNSGNVSSGTTCTQTITINPTIGGSPTTTQIATVPSPTASASLYPSPTPNLATPTPTSKPVIAPPGPGDRFLSFGTLGIVSAIIGVVLLLGL